MDISLREKIRRMDTIRIVCQYRWKQERLGWFTVIFLLNICAKLFMERTTSKSKSFILTVDRGFKRVMVHLIEINGIIWHFGG
jgi:hypothetical protein